MSNIDKRALREAAEKATPGDWWIDSHGMAMVAHHNDNTMIVFVTDGEQMGKAIRHEDTGNLSHWRNDNDASFIAAANPATVLALLDELEAKDKSISFLKDQLSQLANFNPNWDKLEAATDSLREHMAELTAARKRIAELEAREVKLPNPHAHLIWIQAGHAPDDYWDDVAVSHSEKDKCCDGSDRYPVYALWEIKEALSAIGINIAAAGKGEDS